MDEDTPQASITERYQQIQALTPAGGPEEIDSSPSVTISTFLSISLFIFFFVLIFLGFLPLVVQKFKDFKRFQLALVLAFVGAALPLSLGLLFARTGLLTKATVEEIPRQIQIESQEKGFSVKWETALDQYGAIRYGSRPVAAELTRTVLEKNGLEQKQQHEVIVEDLEPETIYYFQILSGTRWYDNSETLLSVLTPPND